MKKITLREFWEEHAPSMPKLGFDDKEDMAFCNQPPLEDELFEKVLSNDVELQLALMSDLAVKTVVQRKDPTCAASVSFQFMFGNESEKRYYEKTLKNFFSLVFLLSDENTKETVGFYTVQPNSETVLKMKKMYENGKLDKIVSHFLPLDAEEPQYTESAAYVLECINMPDKKTICEMQESGFYRLLKKNISIQKAAFFMTNGFSAKNLERDPYIQALIALNHNVFVTAYANDEMLTVVVM